MSFGERIRKMHRAAALAAVACAAFCFTTLAQENLETSSSLKGDCRAELNGVDIGCSGIAIYSHFKNGRELISFIGQQIASVGFAVTCH